MADFFDMESQEALRNIGKMGLTLLRGVIEDGGSIVEGLTVVTAYYTAMLQIPKQEPANE